MMDSSAQVGCGDPHDQHVPIRESTRDTLKSSRGAATPPLPPTIRRWVTYLLAFGVSVESDLPRFLAYLEFPCFSPLLNLLPDTVRQSLSL